MPQIIDPEKSSVKLMGPKVEITLRKAEPGAWGSLESPLDSVSAEKEQES